MKEIRFFNDKEDLKEIITKDIKNIKHIEQIQTGWTNYVLRVETELENYIFRFPRNNFFADALLKECEIVCNIKNFVSFKTPDFCLKYNKNRPYTIHKEINGVSLSSCYNNLSCEEKETLAVDICRMLDEFYKIDITNYKYQTVSNFLDNLSFVSKNNYDLSMHNKLKENEEKYLVFSHGDFNPGNIILKDKKLVAIIDFAFSGVSSPLTDLSRIIGRCPEDFKEIFINNYEKYFRTKIDRNSLEEIQKIWAYVEEKYILYIKQNHPSIVLPNLV